MTRSTGDEGRTSRGQSPVADVLREILRTLPIGIAVTDRDGARVYANPAAGRHARADRPRNAAAKAAEGGPVTERAIVTHRNAVVVGGQPYEVVTSTDVTEQRRLEDDLFRRAYFDDLTGLPNRSLLEQNIKQLIATCRDDQPFALAFIDVDNFKHINDYYGHGAGDELLVKLARRISEQLRSTDILARVGGDEFLMLFTQVDRLQDLQDVLDNLLLRLKEPFFIDGYEIFSSASIGVSLYPMHGHDYESLRINADSAMYRLKSGTKGGVKFFEQDIGHAVSERMHLEQRLRLAIRDRRLCCAFQPKVDFRTMEVVGLEVLLRWRDEGGVIQPPGDFIRLATELGLIDEVTHLVLADTVESIDLINEAFGREATISINVAAKQAGDVAFMTSIARSIAATGLAKRFMVELTEETFLVKTQFQSCVLPLLRAEGIRVSIDDFGIGYSSLSALADITADEIKVDRAFITAIHQRPRSQIILKAIESLGKALGMSVLVEGVETFEELAYLQAATQIRYAQGFYFAKPMFLADLSGRRSMLSGARPALPRRASASDRLIQGGIRGR